MKKILPVLTLFSCFTGAYAQNIPHEEYSYNIVSMQNSTMKDAKKDIEALLQDAKTQKKSMNSFIQEIEKKYSISVKESRTIEILKGHSSSVENSTSIEYIKSPTEMGVEQSGENLNFNPGASVSYKLKSCKNPIPIKNGIQTPECHDLILNIPDKTEGLQGDVLILSEDTAKLILFNHESE